MTKARTAPFTTFLVLLATVACEPQNSSDDAAADASTGETGAPP